VFGITNVTRAHRTSPRAGLHGGRRKAHNRSAIPGPAIRPALHGEVSRGRLAVSLVSAPLLLVKGVPREARQMRCVACGTRQADPEGRLEAASSLNASVSEVRGQSRSAFQPAKDDLASAVAPAMRLKRVFSQEQGYWSDAEVVPG
jgi:hypothetical protein